MIITREKLTRQVLFVYLQLGINTRDDVTDCISQNSVFREGLREIALAVGEVKNKVDGYWFAFSANERSRPVHLQRLNHYDTQSRKQSENQI